MGPGVWGIMILAGGQQGIYYTGAIFPYSLQTTSKDKAVFGAYGFEGAFREEVNP